MKLRLPIDLDRWQRIEPILDQALELPTGEQSAFLDQVCASDPDLRAEVEVFLSADAAAGGFLGVPAGEYAPDLFFDEREESAEDLAGRQIGPYRLLREVGRGGMGTVYEAEDERLGRRVAVKLLPRDSRDRAAKEQFLREARAAAGVDHPNLCTVHDVGECDGRLYIVLAFYEGETLRERIRRGPLPIAEAQDVAIQVARGLTRAHEAGVVHRDIKPANVMLTRRGEAKILDFGIARLQGDETSLTRTGVTLGTPAYMSPEQARGEPVDARTDVWSLGVMLYEMIAGRRPFGDETVEVVVSAILTQEPEPLETLRPDVPEELSRIVERALIKDPRDRYSAATELLTALESGSVPARGSSTTRRRLPLLAGALLLVLATGLLWWRSPAAARPPIKVAVLQPNVKSDGTDPELAFVSSQVVPAALSTLVNLDGIQVLDPPEQGEDKRTEAQRLREADEVLLSSLDCRDDACQVTFRRRKPDGVVLAVSEPFEVPRGIENAYQLVQGVRVYVRQIYSAHRPRRDVPGRPVRPEDFSTYIELQRRVDGGESLGIAEINQLTSLVRTSPGLVAAYVLATDMARRQGDTERALNYVAQAEKLAPYDPRPLIAHLRVDLEGNRLDAAPSTLARLENLFPGDVRWKTARADVLEARGKLKEALSLREEVARRRPTWRHVLKLATLEFHLGASGSSRRHLESILAEQPDNQYALESLAAVESVFGDPKRAATIYEKLIRIDPTLAYLTANLGLAYFLLGDYDSAAATYRRALASDPDDRMCRFNLATTLEAQGEMAAAWKLYGTLAKEVAAMQPPLDEYTRMLHAQCLARLGQKEAAARLAHETLQQGTEDVQILHQAAQVYAILNEPGQALFYIELALKKGLSRKWFTVPGLRSLEDRPKFQKLLDRYTTH